LKSLFAVRQLSAPWALCPSTTDPDTVPEWLTWATVGMGGVVYTRLASTYQPSVRGWRKYKVPETTEAISPFVAIKWLVLAGFAAVMSLGGVNALIALFSSDEEPTPAPTVTVSEIQLIEPTISDDIPDHVIDDALSSLPTSSACTDADARGEIPRDRWTPCGQVLGYFDDRTTPPPVLP
jgi:hypothetical protein